MEINITDKQSMEKNKEKEFVIMLVETDMKEILKMVKFKEKEFFIG